MTKQVIVISGGLDSSTLLSYVKAKHDDDELYCISFDYGQRHYKELTFAEYQAKQANAHWELADLTPITNLLVQSGSSLISDTEVPEGHYAADNMKQTVVPNRNMIMTSVAIGHAVAIEADAVWLGVHAGDHFIYPDCRPIFFQALNAAAVHGNAGFGRVPDQHVGTEVTKFIKTPFLHWTKGGIARAAFELKVDIANTWSCYKGGAMHCGMCGTCVERAEAINETGHIDPTAYENPNFWREAVKV